MDGLTPHQDNLSMAFGYPPYLNLEGGPDPKLCNLSQQHYVKLQASRYRFIPKISAFEGKWLSAYDVCVKERQSKGGFELLGERSELGIPR